MKNTKVADIETILSGDVLSMFSISANQVKPKGANNTMYNTMNPLKVMNCIILDNLCIFDLLLIHKDRSEMNTQIKLNRNRASSLSELNSIMLAIS